MDVTSWRTVWAMRAARGQAKVALDATEWRYVPGGTCKQLKGLTEDEAQAKLRS